MAEDVVALSDISEGTFIFECLRTWRKIMRSCGDTVLKLEVELETLPLKSKPDAMTGEEKAVEAPPSKAGNSSRSTSSSPTTSKPCFLNAGYPDSDACT